MLLMSSNSFAKWLRANPPDINYTNIKIQDFKENLMI